ncbi:MAG: NAD(P)H-dependent oxidoreductase, partial [Candidatus Peribacteraceae bacterium]|nr:NAD(P)H-dependent oxidoreductase [Candidatus Peribacteraceae bacterium]
VKSPQSCISPDGIARSLVNILVLIAGTNDPSNCALLAEHFAAGMERIPDSSVTTIRLKDLPLDHFSLQHYAPSAPEEPGFRRLREALKGTHGLVIASPVWNFSVPAHLKNAIDRMGSFGLDSTTRSRGTLNGLPFFLLFTGGAPPAAWTGLMRRTTGHLARSLQYFGASHCGTHYEGRCMAGRGSFGLVVDGRPECLAMMEQNGERFARLVERFARTGRLPLRQSFLRRIILLIQKWRSR